jgi:uncharacterized protein YqgC (DUF456 family)
MADTALIVLSFLLALVGMAGALLPVIPGPALGLLGLVVFGFSAAGQGLGWGVVAGMGVLAGVLMVLDYVVPAVGAKRFGATRAGVWGSVVGMIVGFFVLPGWGIIFGTLAGAVLGELLAGQTRGAALRAGWGVFVGNLFGVGLKLAYGMAVLVILIQALI